MRQLSKVKIGLGIMLALLVTAVLVFHEPEIRVTVLDPRVHVFSVKLLDGTNDSFYLGNQLEGRVRDFLRRRLHLKVTSLPKVGGLPFASRIGPSRVCILYRWAGADPTPRFVIPKLVDGSGKAVYSTFSSAGQNPYWCIWSLDGLPSGSGKNRWKLSLTMAGTNLVEVDFRYSPTQLSGK